MGIKGLATFIEEKLCITKQLQLRNCDVVLDGNSIYHQIYSREKFICLFGGEYDRFYRYCIQLLQSFRKCEINVIVVFDGAQLDDRKWSTTLGRAKQRIDKSSSTDLQVDLNPLLLRETFISVLDDMKIPYVSALGEGDDESVSLANHLNCYLIAQDGDYYCYNLRRGYVPFKYVNIDPIKDNLTYYLRAQWYHIDFLVNRFKGLKPSTLALACCLCGNDYTDVYLMKPIFIDIITALKKLKQFTNDQDIRMKNLMNAMTWLRQFDDINTAFRKVLSSISLESDRNKIESQLRTAVQGYLTPSDGLIYRFISPNNQKLQTNSHFVEIAQAYLNTLGMNDDQIRDHVAGDSQRIRSKNNHSLPLLLTDAVSDLRLLPSFIEIFIHRRWICSAHIEMTDKPSIYEHAIPIILPCLAILLKWDQEQGDSSVTMHYRVNNQLEAHHYPLNMYNDDLPQLDQIHSMSPDDRQNFVRQCLEMPNELFQQWNGIHSDHIFWLMIIRYWYLKRKLPKVYLYAVIICLVKVAFLRNDKESELIREQLNSLTSAFGNLQNRQPVDPTICQEILEKLKVFYKEVIDNNSFDNSIIHELNCLQTVYIYSLKLNDFFNKPFPSSILPRYFISGSLFHAFVYHYRTNNNIDAAMSTLFLNTTVLLDFMNNLYTCISTEVQNQH